VGQLTQVVTTAVREVRVRLGHHTTRHGRQFHQLRVRRLLTTQHDDRPRPGEQRVQPVLPRAAATQ
jgi:hypothetical protein